MGRQLLITKWLSRLEISKWREDSASSLTRISSGNFLVWNFVCFAEASQELTPSKSLRDFWAKKESELAGTWPKPRVPSQSASQVSSATNSPGEYLALEKLLFSSHCSFSNLHYFFIRPHKIGWFFKAKNSSLPTGLLCPKDLVNRTVPRYLLVWLPFQHSSHGHIHSDQQ